MTQRVLAIHDLCSFGRCSLTMAMPVISAMGIQVCPFPTAWCSNNLTYGDFAFKDFTADMQGFMKRWEQLGLHYDAIYSGFLADAAQVAVVEEAVKRFAGKDTLVVVDPAMGDDGKLYPVFDASMPLTMKSLVSRASLITPNYTEACLLLGRELQDPAEMPAVESKALRNLCEDLADLGAGQIVITSVPAGPEYIKVASFDRASAAFSELSVKRLPLTTCGTGDLFTSVVTGAVLNGRTLEAAVALAAQFASFVIDYTCRSGRDSREGVVLEPCLKKLIELSSRG